MYTPLTHFSLKVMQDTVPNDHVSIKCSGLVDSFWHLFCFTWITVYCTVLHYTIVLLCTIMLYMVYQNKLLQKISSLKMQIK